MRLNAAVVRLLQIVLSASLSQAVPAQTASGYSKPDEAILKVMQAPAQPSPFVSPQGDTILLVAAQPYPSIDRVATPFLRLAGVRIEPGNHSKHDTPGGYGITACAASYAVVHVADGQTVPITLPDGACPGPPKWSADGKLFAFSNLAKTSVELWIGDATTASVHRVDGVALNPMFGSDFQWLASTHTLLAKLVPAGIGAMPTAPAVLSGPGIQEALGTKGASSTYEVRDVLTNKHDEDVFDYLRSHSLR